MRAWFRANRLALAALPVCLALLGVLLVVLPLADDREDVAGTVGAGRAGEVDGVRYSITAAAEFGRDEGIRPPPGAALVAAVVQATPVGRSTGTCEFTLTGPVGDEQRRWPAEFDVTRYGYGRGTGFETSCRARPTAPYRAEIVFLTPAGAGRTAVLEVRGFRPGASRSEVLRLRLPQSRSAR